MRETAVGDVVRAVTTGAGEFPVVVELLEPSDRVTVRVICFRSGPLGGDLQRVIDVFAPLGAQAEGAEQYGMVALDIPPVADLPAIIATLCAGRDDGSWTFEEGSITEAWDRAAQSLE